jgi:hypothetical protein
MWGGHAAHRVSLSNHIIGVSYWRWGWILEVLTSITQNLLLTTGYYSFWSIPPISQIVASSQVNSSKKFLFIFYLIAKLTSKIYTGHIIKYFCFFVEKFETNITHNIRYSLENE